MVEQALHINPYTLPADQQGWRGLTVPGNHKRKRCDENSSGRGSHGETSRDRNCIALVGTHSSMGYRPPAPAKLAAAKSVYRRSNVMS